MSGPGARALAAPACKPVRLEPAAAGRPCYDSDMHHCSSSSQPCMYSLSSVQALRGRACHELGGGGPVPRCMWALASGALTTQVQDAGRAAVGSLHQCGSCSACADVQLYRVHCCMSARLHTRGCVMCCMIGRGTSSQQGVAPGRPCGAGALQNPAQLAAVAGRPQRSFQRMLSTACLAAWQPSGCWSQHA